MKRLKTYKMVLQLLVLVLVLSACGAKESARTVDTAGTKLPTVHIEQDGNYRLMQVIGDLNIRPCAGTTCGIVRVAHDGEVLRVYGLPVVNEDIEIWQQVQGGWVDPKFLKAVTK